MGIIDKLNQWAKKISFPDDFTNIIPLAIQPIDNNFKSDIVIQYAKNLFFIVSDCYCDSDYNNLRSFCSDELYNKLKNEITSLSSQNKRKVMEEIKITRSFLHLYKRNKINEYLYIVFTINSRFYISDTKHNNTISGDTDKKSKRQFMLLLKRNLGTLTTSSDRKNSGRYCPNCEKPIDFNENAVCNHCGNRTNTGEFNWILDDFIMVTDELDFDNRGVVIEI